MKSPLIKAAFLDRDGVINVDKGYVHCWSDFEFIQGSIEGMKTLQESGYTLVIVTNQSGLARGFYTEEQYRLLNKALIRHLSKYRVYIAGIYHCPHHPDGAIKSLAIKCECRKPKPGLINQAVKELGIDKNSSLLIGDKISDLEAARSAGVGQAYLVGRRDNKNIRFLDTIDTNQIFKNLYECVHHILK